jgi:hypothetical protein
MKLTKLEREMFEALCDVLSAWRSYGAIALRSTDEYKSLSAVRRALKHAKEKMEKP